MPVEPSAEPEPEGQAGNGARLEKLIGESEPFRDLLLTAQNQLGLGVVISDPATQRILYVNDAFCEVTGYSEAELLALPTTFQLLAPEEAPVLRERAHKHPTLGRAPDHYETVLVRKDGRRVIVEVAVQGVDSADGPRVVALHRDITQRRRAEETLDLTRELALVIAESESTQDALRRALRRICQVTGWSVGEAWAPSADGKVLECQPAWFATRGGLESFRRESEAARFAPGSGLPGRVWQSRRPEWIADVRLDPYFPRSSAARQAGLVAGMAVPVFAGQRVVAVLALFHSERRDRDDALITLVSTGSAQLGPLLLKKQAEDALVRARDQMDQTLAAAGEGICVLDPSSRITFVNPMAARMLGWEPAELIGRDFHEAAHHHRSDGSPYERESCPICRSVRTGEPSRSEAETLWRRDGTGLPVEYNLTPIRGGRQSAGSVIILRDLTERRRAEEQRIQLIREQMARAGAEAGERRSAFLAEATQRLAAAPDVGTRSQGLARLAVPALADWSVVFLNTPDGTPQAVAASHIDSGSALRLNELLADWHLNPKAEHGASQVLRTGAPEILPEVKAEHLRTWISTELGRDRLLELGAASSLCVPLQARGRILGALLLASTDPRRRYGAADASFAEDLAHRAALELDNARLYQESQAELDQRRRAEEQLRLYKEIFEASKDAIAVMDARGAYLFQNQAHRDLLGYSDEELHGTTPAAHFGDARYQAVLEALSREGRYRGELVSRTRSGRSVDVDLSAFPINDAAGRPICFVGIQRDVSERKREQHLLRRQYRELEAIYRLTDRVARASDLEGIYRTSLDAMIAALGADRAAVLLQDPDGVMRFKAWNGVSDAYRAAVEGQSPWPRDAQDPAPVAVADVEDDATLAHLRPVLRQEGIRALAFLPLVVHGRLIGKFMLYYSEPHAFLDDELRLAQTVGRNVAFAIERVRVADELRRSQAELQDFVENATVGLHWIDERGRILWANRAQLDLLGCSENEYVGRNLAEFHRDPPALRDLLGRLARGETIHDYEARLQSKDGSVRHVLIDADVYYEHGRFVHSRFFTRDITPRKRAEEQLRAANERLRQADRFKTEFINTAAHELNTPLTPIRLQLDILRSAFPVDLSPETRRHLEILGRNFDRLARLVQDVLEVARHEAGRVRLARETVDLAQVVREAVESYAESARQAGVALETRLEDGVRPSVDAKRLIQVLSNLLSNALKFTPSGGRVSVETHRGDGRAIVRIHDTGPGLSDEQAARLFQPFTQVHAGAGSDSDGTGLGLYISRGIIEGHGGRIWVESEPGAGSTFIFELPL